MPITKDPNLPISKEEFDKAYTRVKIAYRKHGGNKIKMARELGISYHSALQALRVCEKVGMKIRMK